MSTRTRSWAVPRARWILEPRTNLTKELTAFEIEAQRDETCCLPSWEIISVNADVSVTDQQMRCAPRMCRRDPGEWPEGQFRHHASQ